MTEHDRTAQDGGFVSLGLPEGLLKALGELGYEAPSPIQSKTIPVLMGGRDLVGQAQTGTGKTAAFALPVLARLKQAESKPAALVLAPTRELAIQVAEAFHRYAAHLPGFHVLPIYGGQAYGPQLAGLRRGADVVVGTPGRVIDHINKGTLDLGGLGTLVLDEADEMLRMGFIDDVEQVLSKTPENCQIALFSATMPQPIRRIAQRYLKDAEEVTIKAKTSTAASIRQRYWLVSGLHKLDALTRILEVEPFEGMIVFARTRVATEELANRLNARGFSAAALNGDVPQNLREQLVEKLRKGEVDILVATDVAASGLDVERVSHVVNYDIPYDTEAYVHRIGSTGRAGRAGEAILFVAPRERGMLRAIERATRQPIEAMGVPSVADVNEQRVARFKAAVAGALETEELDLYREVAQACQAETGAEMVDIAAALARLLRGGDDFLLSEREPPADFAPRPDRKHEKGRRPDRSERPARRPSDDHDKATFRIEVGRSHGIGPGNIVGAIANEANLDAGQIGRVRIQEHFSLVDLPADLDTAVFRHLARVRVGGRPLNIKPDQGPGHHPKTSDRPAPRGRRHTESKDRRTPRPNKPPHRTRQESASAPEERERSKPKDKNPPRKNTKQPENKSGETPPRKRPSLTRAQKKAGHGNRKARK